MKTTTNSIAAYAANTPARGRFGIKNITSENHSKFKPNRHVAGIEPAQSAIKFVAFREKFQANASRADPAKGLHSLASWDATGYIRITRTTADAQGNSIGSQAEAGFTDVIYASATGSHMQGLGGNDALAGGASVDYIVADVRANPNGGLDESGQLRPPPPGFSNSNILTAQYTGTDSPMQGYGWAIYNKDSNSTISVPSTMVHSGDTNDVFIDGAGRTLSSSTPTNHLHIDSKLCTIYWGNRPISLQKQNKPCVGADRKQRLKTIRTSRPYKTSFSRYGKRSKPALLN